ncbi:hypothetical protein [Aphanothece sacrum]|uniref:Uncharacterized protein n=1 Tax=Aphanothece sacrum FPU1 TaxID=1920663 RepID=A0A401INC2_APHSA|nr:hypothetical protein [Aphanothece sacrum]GBF82760.1 hypothetical protein AsFPU1_4194 [Aphanothece sacrum FPU1]GBF85716.1 hypothetical protein AsFPU3_2781 [Aphanothece sacrum FPU3]
MSRFSQLIQNLENLEEQDIKNSAKVFGITATLSTRLADILQELESPTKQLSATKITKQELLKKYGNYDKAYTAYQESYGIKSKRGWPYFLKAIEGLSPPISLEERVEKLEETVKILVQILIMP